MCAEKNSASNLRFFTIVSTIKVRYFIFKINNGKLFATMAQVCCYFFLWFYLVCGRIFFVIQIEGPIVIEKFIKLGNPAVCVVSIKKSKILSLLLLITPVMFSLSLKLFKIYLRPSTFVLVQLIQMKIKRLVLWQKFCTHMPLLFLFSTSRAAVKSWECSVKTINLFADFFREFPASIGGDKTRSLIRLVFVSIIFTRAIFKWSNCAKNQI